MKKIAIIGAGGFGLEVAMLIEQINEYKKCWDLIGYFDDNLEKGSTINGYEILGCINDINLVKDTLYIVLAIGDPTLKRKILSKISNAIIKFPTLVHPSVIMGNKEYIDIGDGTIICAGCIITTNIKIGNHVILNLSCTVGHETFIGKYSSFMPSCNISGQVNIGESTYCGTGAKIINKVNIGSGVTIGAGAVVINDIPGNVKIVGVPAKIK